MFKFRTEQKIIKVGNFRIGGQAGELPTALVGNIFYKGMPEITDHEKGEFDAASVLKWVRVCEQYSEKTGVPHCFDVMASFPEAMRKFVAFIAERSESVFLIDGANSDTRVAGLEAIRELGLQKRTVFNGVSPQTGQIELDAVHDAKVTASVLLAQNEIDYSPRGRISTLQGSDGQESLIDKAKKAGIDRFLIDTIVFDVPSIAHAIEAIRLVKDELGFPAGCSPANATYDWKASQDKTLRKSFVAYNASAHALAQLSGANFLIYGPLKQAPNVIPACAMTDAIIAYGATKQFGTKPLVENHPLYKIF